MTKLRQNVYYKSIYITWMYMVFIYVLPFAGLSILNMLIFLDVRYVLETVQDAVLELPAKQHCRFGQLGPILR